MNQQQDKFKQLEAEYLRLKQVEMGLLERMRTIQRQIQAEHGAMDQRVYRQTLAEIGLDKEYEANQDAIRNLLASVKKPKGVQTI